MFAELGELRIETVKTRPFTGATTCILIGVVPESYDLAPHHGRVTGCNLHHRRNGAAVSARAGSIDRVRYSSREIVVGWVLASAIVAPSLPWFAFAVATLIVALACAACERFCK